MLCLDSFLAMSLIFDDFDFCCLYCLTWRINQSHVVTNIQSSFLQQCYCHSLCSLVQLDARCGARYSALHTNEATSENIIQTVLQKVHAADAIFHRSYFNNTANACEDSVSVLQNPCCWYPELSECYSILYRLFWTSDSEAPRYHKKNVLLIFEISQSKGENTVVLAASEAVHQLYPTSHSLTSRCFCNQQF